jgi:hypothetical protein
MMERILEQTVEAPTARQRLAWAREHLRELLDEINRLELEVGNHPCAACGATHAGERCLEQAG